MKRPVRRLAPAATNIPQRLLDKVLSRLSKLEVEVVRLRFGLRNARLYSFWVA